MKKDYDISKQMQDDLIRAYNKVAPTCWRQEEAYQKAVKQPAARYYVSQKQAAQVLSKMVRGDFEFVDIMLPNKKRLYYSLYEKFLELSEKREFIGKSLNYIAGFAILQPAPEFFISPSRFSDIRIMMKKGNCDDGKLTYWPSTARCYEKLKEKRRKLKEYRLKNQPQSSEP